MGDPVPVLLQGDSRRAAAIVQGHFSGCVVSPPFSDSLQNSKERSGLVYGNARYGHKDTVTDMTPHAYGQSPGQLGSMREGDFSAAISSPPYVGGGHHADQTGAWNTNGRGQGQTRDVAGYGQTPSQLGQMKEGDVDAAISSPPYNGPFSQTHPGTAGGKRGTESPDGGFQRYGNTPGQLEGLPDGGVDAAIEGFQAAVSSPPFMSSDNRDPSDKTPRMGRSVGPKYSNESPRNSTIGGDRTSDRAKAAQKERAEAVKNLGEIVSVGNNGTLVNLETFWSAAREILLQVWKLLKPVGYCAWIVKDYVKAGKRVPFCDNWARLCEACGFEVIERAHAMLVKEETHPGLFGAETKRKERKSFFRRLAEKKGSPRIDHEEVIFARKP